jgi:hypothetical protein
MSYLQKPETARVANEVNGLEMGVLQDGTPFLSMRGLSELCGVSNANLSVVSAAWLQGKRDSKLAQFLVRNGVVASSLYTEIASPKNPKVTQYAFPDHISTLVLEFYAYEAATPSPLALQNYRITSRAGLRLFIYSALGYDPSQLVPQPWRQFHDRMTLVSAPTGYFSVFKESADFVINSIRGGLPVDDKTVPDISIGGAWAAYWKAEKLAEQFGERVKFDHNYPEYFAQAASNPQPINVYPVAALGHFRIWLQTIYVPEKFPAYITTKVYQGVLPASVAQVMLLQAGAPVPKQLTGG